MQTFARLLVLALLGLLTGCGGASAFDRDVDPHPLAGSWFGTYDADFADGANSPAMIRIEFRSNGNISQIVIGGTVSPLTGTLVGRSNDLFIYVLSDMSDMSIHRDSDGERIGFVISDDSVGILRRNATALPGFSAADAVGNFNTGTEYEFDASYGVTNRRDGRALVTNPPGPLDITTSQDDPPNCDSVGTLSGLRTGFGVFDAGSFMNGATPMDPACPASGEFKGYLSTDFALLFVIACAPNFTTVTAPLGCTFGFYER